MLSRLRIGPKLLLAPGVVLILLVVLSCGAYYTMVRQNQSLEVIVVQRAASIRAASELVSSAHQAHAEIYQLLTWQYASFTAPRIDALARAIHARHRAIDGRFRALSAATAQGSEERRFIGEAGAAYRVYVNAVLDVIELSRDDGSISANAMSKAERAFGVVSVRLGELLRMEQRLSEAASQSAASDFKAISTLMPVLIVLSVVLSLAITVAVRRELLDEVSDIGRAATGLACGDLTVRQRVYGRDEIAETSRALDTSIRNLNAALKTILDSARSIDTASREIGLGNATRSMDEMTQQDAALVAQAAAAAERLQDQAHSLSRAVAAFKLDEVEPPAARGHLRLASKRG